MAQTGRVFEADQLVRSRGQPVPSGKKRVFDVDSRIWQMLRIGKSPLPRPIADDGVLPRGKSRKLGRHPQDPRQDLRPTGQPPKAEKWDFAGCP